jgi:hypothetical protein
MTDDPGKLPDVDAPPPPIAAYVLVGAVALLLVVFAFGVFGGIPDTPRGQLLRVGAILLAVGMVFVAYIAWRVRQPGRLPGIAEDGASYAIARLTMRRDVLASAWVWFLLPLVPGVALLYAGAANLRSVGIGWALAGLVVCAIAFIAVAVVTRRAAAQIDTQIAELEKQR